MNPLLLAALVLLSTRSFSQDVNNNTSSSSFGSNHSLLVEMPFGLESKMASIPDSPSKLKVHVDQEENKIEYSSKPTQAEVMKNIFDEAYRKSQQIKNDPYASKFEEASPEDNGKMVVYGDRKLETENIENIHPSEEVQSTTPEQLNVMVDSVAAPSTEITEEIKTDGQAVRKQVTENAFFRNILIFIGFGLVAWFVKNFKNNN